MMPGPKTGVEMLRDRAKALREEADMLEQLAAEFSYMPQLDKLVRVLARRLFR
jgi:hypothetical protein